VLNSLTEAIAPVVDLDLDRYRPQDRFRLKPRARGYMSVGFRGKT
jgi:hypothetical protein